MYLNTYLWEYIVNVIEILLFYFYVRAMFQTALQYRHQVVWQILFLVLYGILMFMLNYFQISTFITILLSCFIDILYVSVFYAASAVRRIFWGSIYSVICLISEYITFLIPRTIYPAVSSALLPGGELRIPFTLLYLSLIAVCVFLLPCMTDQKIHLSPVQKLFHISIVITGILTGHYIMRITLTAEERFHDPAFTAGLVLINLLFILLFLSLLLYIYQLGCSKERYIKLMEMQKQQELEALEYHRLLETTEALRQMKHDTAIHLDVIASYAAAENISGLLAYIDSYHHSLDHIHQLISTGNTAVDCILSSKINAACQLGINPVLSVIVPETFPLDVLSLSSLLGNLWNNALEACLRLQTSRPDSKPFIRFYIKPFQHMLLIHMENKYEGSLRILADHSYGSVKEGAGHGIGLKRIREIVEKADGIIQIGTDGGTFSVHIMIPAEG